MPDRILRDEILRSHRFVGLSSDTLRLVFVAFVLCADDLGNAEATPTAIGIMLVRAVPEEMAAKWIAELADADLVRTYESDGKRYIHIPRFRQRLRYTTGKHPRPPANIECNEIRQLATKVRPQSVSGQTVVSLKTAEVKRSEVKRSEEKKDLPPPVDNFDEPQVKTVLIKGSDQNKPMTREEQIAFVAAHKPTTDPNS